MAEIVSLAEAVAMAVRDGDTVTVDLGEAGLLLR